MPPIYDALNFSFNEARLCGIIYEYCLIVVCFLFHLKFYVNALLFSFGATAKLDLFCVTPSFLSILLQFFEEFNQQPCKTKRRRRPPRIYACKDLMIAPAVSHTHLDEKPFVRFFVCTHIDLVCACMYCIRYMRLKRFIWFHPHRQIFYT